MLVQILFLHMLAANVWLSKLGKDHTDSKVYFVNICPPWQILVILHSQQFFNFYILNKIFT